MWDIKGGRQTVCVAYWIQWGFVSLPGFMSSVIVSSDQFGLRVGFCWGWGTRRCRQGNDQIKFWFTVFPEATFLGSLSWLLTKGSQGILSWCDLPKSWGKWGKPQVEIWRKTLKSKKRKEQRSWSLSILFVCFEIKLYIHVSQPSDEELDGIPEFCLLTSPSSFLPRLAHISQAPLDLGEARRGQENR